MSKRTAKLYLRGAVAGEFGKTFVLTLKNFESINQDVSAYTAIQMNFRSPEGSKTFTSTGAFVTDGSDAQISFAFDSDDYPDRPGVWDCQAKLIQTGQESKSLVFELEVDQSLG